MIIIQHSFLRSQSIMQTLVAVLFAVGSVSALGSGPYLPSGWKPEGPAFYLPGEVQKPADNPLKETIVFETEASGSDSLREYGPPKIQEVTNAINQGLPDVATEQTFLVFESKEAASVVVEENLTTETEVTIEEKPEVIEEVQEATTESQLAEVVTEVFADRLADIELQDVTTASYIETEVVKSEEVEATVASVPEKLEEAVLEEVKAVEEVQNVAEAIVTLENEIKAEKVQVETDAEVKVNQEGSGSAQAPEGFLEYGPPGFREYGPPKGEELQKIIVEEIDSSLGTNEARRRRFSPKIRATQRHH